MYDDIYDETDFYDESTSDWELEHDGWCDCSWCMPEREYDCEVCGNYIGHFYDEPEPPVCYKEECLAFWELKNA